MYVVANIRGGGEYGPRWHQAALKAEPPQGLRGLRRGRARTWSRARSPRPQHLGIMGGSNGGLLMGNMLTQYPELFGAVVVQVPLLDMKRYSHLLAGASWMAEYGDPDTADWDFIQHVLAVPAVRRGKHAIRRCCSRPRPRDDRVHPGHARKMAAEDARRRTRTCATTRTSKAATAARPTTRRRRTCGRWPTPSCGTNWQLSNASERAAPSRTQRSRNADLLRQRGPHP